MKLYIRNMVCNRCIMVVRSELEKAGFNPLHVGLGEVELEGELSDTEKVSLNKRLAALGFSLIDDKRSRIIEKIKNLITELVYQKNNDLRSNLSDYLSDALRADYSSLSNLFAQIENTTIEHYYIAQKIERVKELLVYDELSLSEIADMLHYSSVSHVSKQFKQVTGLTPTHYKQLKENKRRPLDEL